MAKKDKRVDVYITRAPQFARPILTTVRGWMHEGAPDCEEALKWGHPAFLQEGILCGMVAFKEYCGVHFWQGKNVVAVNKGPHGPAQQLGKLLAVKDLPSKRVFLGYVRKAVELNASGVKVARPTKPKKPFAVPAEFRKAMDRDAKAKATFDGFSPSHRREYAEWIADAKQEATRERRIAQALEWLAEGKPRNWKYMK